MSEKRPQTVKTLSVVRAPQTPTATTEVTYDPQQRAHVRSAVARQRERETGRPTGDPMPVDEARKLTDRIKADAESLWELIKQAYLGRAWIALGYETWDAYCIREFGSARLRLPREERPEMVASLRQSGLSIRAIASATGVNHQTVANDLSKNRHLPPADGPVDAEVDEDALAEELIAAEPAPVVGVDGKRYPPRMPKMPKTLREKFERSLVNDDDDSSTDDAETDYITGRFEHWGEVSTYVANVVGIGLRRVEYGELGDDADLVIPLTADDLPPDDDDRCKWCKTPRLYAEQLRAALPRIHELLDRYDGGHVT